MAENEKNKKKKVAKEETLQRTDYHRVGDTLREAREEKGVSVETAAAAIHIRAGQVRAIEDGNLDALPGITYATGFIRSYANYLKLDSVEIVKRFKAENSGAAAARPELNFPEPLAEDKMPSILMIGLGGFCALMLLIGWVMFSGGGGDDKVAEIPAAPVVAAPAPFTSSIPVDPAAVVAVDPAATVADSAAAVTGAPEVATAPAEDVSALVNAPVAGAVATDPVAPATTTDTSAAAVAAAPATSDAPAQTPVAQAPAAPVPPVAVTPPPAEQIKVAPRKSRITLRATGTSWVQIVDSNRRILYKKVLRAGDQFAVPEQKGLTLMASNAGGVEVYVDGKRTAPLGAEGEVMRGMALDPDTLKRRRNRVRDY